MWELDCEEGWAPKNWCLWTVVLEKTLESPLDCKEISPGISLEGMMLKLKLQYFGHLMRRVDSLEETLMLGGIGGRSWMASLTRWTWVWVNSRSWWWTGRPGMLRFMGSQRVGHDWAAELNWTNWWEASDFVSSVSLETHSFLCPLNWIWVLDVILRLSWFTHLKRSLPVLVYRTQISCEVPAALFYLEKVLMSCHWNLKMTKMVHLL